MLKIWFLLVMIVLAATIVLRRNNRAFGSPPYKLHHYRNS